MKISVDYLKGKEGRACAAGAPKNLELAREWLGKERSQAISGKARSAHERVQRTDRSHRIMLGISELLLCLVLMFQRRLINGLLFCQACRNPLP